MKQTHCSHPNHNSPQEARECKGPLIDYLEKRLGRKIKLELTDEQLAEYVKIAKPCTEDPEMEKICQAMTAVYIVREINPEIDNVLDEVREVFTDYEKEKQ